MLILILMLLFPLAANSYWVIPTDFPTIQAGADGASPGDTLILEPGVYSEEVELPGRLTLASRYLLTGDTSYIGSTILDGQDSLALIKSFGGDTCWISGLDMRRGASWMESNRWWGAGFTVADSGCAFLDHLRIHDCCSGEIGLPYWLVVSYHDSTSLHISHSNIFRHWDEDRYCRAIDGFFPKETSLKAVQVDSIYGGGVFLSSATTISVDSCSFSAIHGHPSYSQSVVGVHGKTIIVRNCLVVNNSGNLKHLINLTSSRYIPDSYCEVTDVIIRDNHLVTENYQDLMSAFKIERIQDVDARRVVIELNTFENLAEGGYGGPKLLVSLVDDYPGTARVDSVVVKNNYVLGDRDAIATGSAVMVSGRPEYDSEVIHHVSRISITDNEYRRTDLEESGYNPPEGGPGGLGIGNGNFIVEDVLVADNAADQGYRSRGLGYGAHPDWPYESHYRVEFRNIEIYNNTWDYWDPSGWSTPQASGIYVRNFEHTPKVVEKVVFDNISLHDQMLGEVNTGFSMAFADTFIVRNSHFARIGSGLGSIGGCDYIELSNVLIDSVFSISTHPWFNYRRLLYLDAYGCVNLNNVTMANITVEDHNIGPGCVIHIWDAADTLQIRNSIIQFETETADLLILENTDSTYVDIQYSNISYGYPGTGNIDVDPLFIDTNTGDFRLQANSPCIDAGNPDPVYNDPEDPDEPGWPLWPAQGTLRNDMGCYGGPGAADFDEFMAVPDVLHHPAQPSMIKLHQNYPNPFNPNTTIEFMLPHPQDVQLTVYNILGKQVQLLTDQTYSAGLHQVRFNGSSLASGVYLYRLTAGDQVETRKMILVK